MMKEFPKKFIRKTRFEEYIARRGEIPYQFGKQALSNLYGAFPETEYRILTTWSDERRG